MTGSQAALSTLEQAWQSIQTAIVAQAPGLLAAILIILAGWIVAALVRTLFSRFAGVIRGGLHRLLGKQNVNREYLSASVIRVSAAMLFWLILLIAVGLAAESLGFSLISAWLAKLVAYIPTLIAAIMIFAVGLLLARLARDLVVSGAWIGKSGQRQLFARIVYVTVAGVTVIIGMDQLGVRVSFLVVILSVALGTFIGGLLLAFALGAQDFVRDLIAAHQLRQLYRIGQRIRYGDYDGVIIAITSVTAILDLPDGKLAIPARRLLAEPVMLLE